jgi:hypothetical protein
MQLAHFFFNMRIVSFFSSFVYMKKVLKNYDYVIKNLKTYMTDNINMTDDKGQQSLI